MENLSDLLSNLAWEELEKEGITKGVVGMIDLEIADDPVEDRLHGVCHTMKTNGGGYIITDFDNPTAPLNNITYSADDIKIMRCRYLIKRGDYSKQLLSLGYSEQQEIMRLYNLDLWSANIIEKIKNMK